MGHRYDRGGTDMIQLHILFTLVGAVSGLLSAAHVTPVAMCRARYRWYADPVWLFWVIAATIGGLAGWCFTDVAWGPL
jgi:hypothetical protein